MDSHSTIRASDAATEDWGKLTANPWYTLLRAHDHFWKERGLWGMDVDTRIATSNALCQRMYEITMEKVRAGI